MKAVRVIVLVAAIVTPLWISFLFLGFAAWRPPKLVERSTFTDEQRDIICRALQFEPAPGETILEARYWPGFMQAKMSLKVIIGGVASEQDFLSRFHGPATLSREKEDTYLIYGTERYEHEHSDGVVSTNWESACTLSFHNGAAFFCIGYGGDIPRFVEIHTILYEGRESILQRELLLNPVVIISLAFEFALLVFLVLTKAIRKKEIAHETHRRHRRPPQRGQIDPVQ